MNKFESQLLVKKTRRFQQILLIKTNDAIR